MVSVEEALRIIGNQEFNPQTEEIFITDAIGRVLGETISADRDFPPFNRVMMDGIAIQYDQLKGGKKKFLIEEIQPAGADKKEFIDFNEAVEVMTGAVLPEGMDTVVRYEDLDIEADHATVRNGHVAKGDHIHRRAHDARAGEELLQPGVVLSPAEVAILAAVGKKNVNVFAYPKTAVISTGNELVDVDSVPEEYQVRQSNSYALQAAMKAMGWEARTYYLTDNEKLVADTLRIILSENDLLIISGGVSKGKFDYIRGALESLEVKRLFYQVCQRPGKPLWFGASEKGKIVFALPGNPVSTYLCFFKYVRPWILKNFKTKNPELSAILKEDFAFEPEYTYFLQVHVSWDKGKAEAQPFPGFGSGDFANLRKVDGFLELPAGKSIFRKGEAYPFIPFRR